MKVVSLFSGAGGLDLGFKMAGHDIIWANDLYGDAVETYRLNLGNHIVCEDIFKVNELRPFRCHEPISLEKVCPDQFVCVL